MQLRLRLLVWFGRSYCSSTLDLQVIETPRAPTVMLAVVVRLFYPDISKLTFKILMQCLYSRVLGTLPNVGLSILYSEDAMGRACRTRGRYEKFIHSFLRI